MSIVNMRIHIAHVFGVVIRFIYRLNMYPCEFDAEFEKGPQAIYYRKSNR